MSKDPLRNLGTKKTPQTEPILGKDMVKSESGGYVFQADIFTRLERFLILGTDGGTYYIDEHTLTRDNAANILACLDEHAKRVVHLIYDISLDGRAPRQNPLLFALAVCVSWGVHADVTDKRYEEYKRYRRDALGRLEDIARTSTHLFIFLNYVQQFRGWGRGLRTAVANWYLSKTPDRLAYQLIKYRQREGWTHRDVLRQAHPFPPSDAHDRLAGWVTGKRAAEHPLIVAYEAATKATTAKEIVHLIQEYRLPREAIPNQWLNEKEVWDALLQNMPYMATMRNLGKMTSVETLALMDTQSAITVGNLMNPDAIKKSRIHPLQILVAQSVYEMGHGWKGSLSWSPIPSIIDALNDAFYLAFNNVEPTGKRFVIGVDASGSMTQQAGNTPLNCRQAAVAQALVIANTEPNSVITAFTMDNHIVTLPISPKQRLDDAMRALDRHIEPQGTDCSLPIHWAREKKIETDVFVILTDNQSWGGGQHVEQALADYNARMSANAKLVVASMVANSISVCDPANPNSMDIVGFDTSLPSLIQWMAR